MIISEKLFFSNAIQGIVIAITFSFLTLIFFTQNIVISLFSILSIAGVIGSVFTFIFVMGWEFGFIESSSLVAMIGFSVDYVVHLANHYVESPHLSRYNKTQEALREIGISVVSGAITTAGSALFLLFAQISVFKKFSAILIMTIVFSILYSLCFFTALCHIMGPEGHTGDLDHHIYKPIKDKCCLNKVLGKSHNHRTTQMKLKKQATR